MNKRAAIYLRVSSAEQGADQHVSLPVQEARCRAYIEQHDWTLVSIESDRESGLKPQRQGYNRVLELARNRAVDVVVVMAASRWGRDAAEVLVRAKELTDLKVELVSTSEDLSSFLMLGIQAVINQEESRRLAARIAPAKRFKVTQGYWQAKPPFGTRNAKGILEPGDDFHYVQLAYRWCIEGVPTREITRRLNGMMAPRTINHSTTRSMLVNEAYIGVIHWKDETFPALWEPLIPLETFRAAGDALRLRYRQRAVVDHAAPYWSAGLVFCGVCGGRLYLKVGARKKQHLYPYFVCSRGQRTGQARCFPGGVRVDRVQAWVVSQLEELRLSEVDVVAKIEAVEREKNEAIEVQRRGLVAERSRLEARIARAEQGYLDGLWDAARVSQIKGGLSDQIAAIYRELLEISTDSTTDYSGLRAFFDDESWLEHRDLAPSEFREMLKEVVSRIVVGGIDDYYLELVPALVDSR